MSQQLLSSTHSDKSAIYAQLLAQIEALSSGEPDLIAVLANISAALKMTFDWLWVGFYLVQPPELVLGPFQGPLACTRIAYGKGVCGSAWQQARTLRVDDVAAFPGHIVCSSLARSEIVVPLFNSAGQVCGVLDVDADTLGHFDPVDAAGLEALAARLRPRFDRSPASAL
jgi:GAF domain-containing protein